MDGEHAEIYIYRASHPKRDVDSAEIPAASKWHIALMPANPEHKLSRNNVVVVDKTTRRVLLQAFRQGGVAKYIAELGTVFP